jgi:CRISPR-associated protein Cas1
MCLREEISVVLLSAYGKVKGRLTPPRSSQVDVRIAQYAAQQDPDRRLVYGRRFAGAKLANMHRRLVRWARRHRASTAEDAAENLQYLRGNLATASSLDEVRGLEGAATRAYYGTWTSLIQRSDPALQFPRRSRRPPEDAVNALLSFTYSLLQKDVHAACVIAGLDPHVGLLHASRPNTPAAVLDLMEAFRPAVVDSTVLALLNRRAFNADHVEERDGGVYLNEEGRKVAFKAYGRRRADTVTPPEYDTALPYYRVFELQARRLAQSLTDGADYCSFKL